MSEWLADATEHPLDVRSDGVLLRGTLAIPHTEVAAPAALLLGGSGPLDRDGTMRRFRLDIQRQFAVALAAAGIASLRFDRRGAGASEGDFLSTGFDTNTTDAAAALEALRAAPGVDPPRVFVVGHSEGALHAIRLLAGDAEVAGGVLLSAPARRGDEVLLWQADVLAPTLPAPVRALLRLMRTDLRSKVRANHDKLRATTTDVARVGGRRVNARWFREFLDYDPAPDLSRIAAPVLALTGAKDLQTPPDDVQQIARLVPGRVDTALVDDVSHILRAQPGPASLRSYRRDVRRPVDRRVTETLTRWLREQTA